MPGKSLSNQLRSEIESSLSLFMSLWDGYQEPCNTVAPHRQRTSVNKLSGFALFLGMPLDKEAPAARPIRTLRAWQKRVGVLRDNDVLRDLIGKCAHHGGEAAQPAAEAFVNALMERRTRDLAAIRVDARGLPGAETRVAVQYVLQDFSRALTDLAGREDDFDFRTALRPVIEPWKESLALLRTNQQDELLHSFRVKNKRLRFSLEVVAGAIEDKALREVVAERADLATRAHNALGALSDLHMLRNRLRGEWALWAEHGARLDPTRNPLDPPNSAKGNGHPLLASARALEAGRALAEAKALGDWYDVWPAITSKEFLAF